MNEEVTGPPPSARLAELGLTLPAVATPLAAYVPAIGSAYGPTTQYMTVNMNLSFLGAVREADVVAEGWVTRRGRSTVFCRAEAVCEDRLVMEGSLVYAVREPR